MNKIDQQLMIIREENRLGLMTHTVVGYPDINESKRLVEVMARTGVDFVELQIPFSDPMADGKTLMKANQMSLKTGTTVEQAMEAMAELSGTVAVPLLFMTYFNIVFRYGVERFCRDAAHAGCSGLIVPDIPLDEEGHEHFIEFANQHDLIPIRLLSPASTDDRIIKNAKLAKSGFIYFVSRKGTTGTRGNLDSELHRHIERVKRHCTVPVAVGFGISTPEHVRQLAGMAEIAVVGSKIVDVYDGANEGNRLEAVQEFIGTLLHAVR